MRLRAGTVCGMTLLAVLVIAAPALAQDGGGGGGKGELYGDLYVIERDGNGEPILDYLGCKQPIASDCSFIPLVGELADETEDPCEIDPAYLELAQEVEMGRLSVSRSHPKVIAESYAEAIDTLNRAVKLRLDPAGRFEMLVVDPDATMLVLTRRAIDSPLENLGLYSRILLDGCLSPVEANEGIHELSNEAKALVDGIGLGHLICPDGDLPDPDGVGLDDMMAAAPFFAAAADKVAHLTLGALMNVNTYLGINEVDNQGHVTYFDWTDPVTGDWFYYSRAEHFPPGVLRWLLTLFRAPDKFLAQWVDVRGPDAAEFPQVRVCRGGEVYPFPCNGVDPGGECGGANWFIQRAEHARSIIWFLHNWTVPIL